MFKRVTLSVDPEILGSFRQYLAAICASISTFICGSAFVWMTPLIRRLLGPDSEVPMTQEQLSWAISIIEIGDVFTPIPCAMLSDRLGRKPVLLMSGPCYLISWVIIQLTRSVPALYVARFIQGMAMGISFTVLPIYLGEISSPKMRGRTGIFVQYFWFVGIIFEVTIGPFLQYADIVWMSLSFTIVFVLLFVWFPESPYFLANRGRDEEAAASLSWFRGGADIQDSRRASRSCWKSCGELLTSRKGLTSLGLAGTVLANALLGGLLTILSYSSVVFSRGADVKCSVILGILLVLGVPFFGHLMDVFGRRPVYLFSSGIAGISVLLVGLYHALRPAAISPWVSDMLLIVYLVFVVGGVEATYPILQSELFSGPTRSLASSIMIITATLFSFISFVVFYYLNTTVGLYANFFMFSFFCAFGFIVIAAFLPETKGKTFEEIQRSQ